MNYTRLSPLDIENIPAELSNYESFICWRQDPPTSPNAKPRKTPIAPRTGNNARVNDPSDWVSRQTAIDAFTKNNALTGIGFVFHNNNPFGGIDIDKSRDPSTGIIAPWAQELLSIFNSYSEISPSQTGIKIIIRGDMANKEKHFTFQGHEIEVYSTGRYFTLTGQHLSSTPKDIHDRQDKINELVPEELPPTESTAVPIPRSEDAAKAVDEMLDEELLIRIEQSAQGEKFKQLMSGSTTGYGGYFAASGALCSILAAWTRCNPERIDRFYRKSGLYEESWWIDKAYSGRRSRAEITIAKSCQLASSGWMFDPTAIDERPEVAKCIKEFNERFFVVEDFGGKCRVCWEEINAVTKTLHIGNQAVFDFKNRFVHQKIQTGVDEEDKAIMTAKGSVWFNHPRRRQYKEIAFLPGETTRSEVKNIWRGFSVEAKKGDCSLYLTHLRENICKGDEKKFTWLICWMAWKVRNPGSKSYTALVLKGAEGVGKNVAADTFAYLFGAHALTVTKKEHVAGHFNAHLRACSILIANEAFFAGDRQHESSLKSLITDPFMMIEAKGVDPVSWKNVLSLIIISNEKWVVPAGPGSRRYSVLDVSDERKEDTKYFGALQKQLANGGYEALLHHLMHEVDISRFDERKAIITAALAEQQALSLRGAEAAWFDCLYEGKLPGRIRDSWLETDRFIAWARRNNIRWEISPQQLGLLLGANTRGAAKGMDFKNQRTDLGQGRKHYWNIPALGEARQKWDDLRFKTDWPELAADENWIRIWVGDETAKERDLGRMDDGYAGLHGSPD